MRLLKLYLDKLLSTIKLKDQNVYKYALSASRQYQFLYIIYISSMSLFTNMSITVIPMTP